MTVMFVLFIATSDFILLTSNLTFSPLDIDQAVVINVINDGYSELTEQFSVEIFSYDNGVLIEEGRQRVQVTVTDQTGKVMIITK